MSRLLALLVSTPGQEFHTRDLVRRTQSSEHPVQRALVLLEEEGLVSSRRVGNLRLWRMDPAHPLYRPIREVFARTVGAVAELRSELSRQRGVELAFLFGSFASGTDDATSDLDLFLVGTPDWGALRRSASQLSDRLRRELRVVAWSPSELARRVAQRDPFLATLIREPKSWVIGGEGDLERRVATVGGSLQGARPARQTDARRRREQDPTRAAQRRPRGAKPTGRRS